MSSLIALALALPTLGAPGGGCSASWTEHANPIPSGRSYGRALAVSGDVLAAASTLSPSGSAVAVHERDAGGPGNWGWSKTLYPGAPSGSFGDAVAAAGDTIVVGAPSEVLVNVYKGAVYVFGRDQGGVGNWGLVQKVFGPNDPGGDFGVAVAIDGDRIAVGTTLPGPGRVTLLGRDVGGADNWGVETVVEATSEHAVRFGRAVAVAGDTVVVGDPEDAELGAFSGAVTVLEPGGGGWSEGARVLPPNGLGGQSFGVAVAIDGIVAVAGASGADPGGVNNAGAAWVLGRDAGGADAWGAVAMLASSTPSLSGRFGLAAAISGELVAVGSPTHSSGPCTNKGRAYLFARDLGGLDAWGEVTPLVAPGECGDRFGDALGLEGTTLAVAAPNADSVAANSGSFFLYPNSIAGGAVPYCTAGTTSSGCRATMSATGTPSATAPTGFALAATNVEGARQGLFFFGTSGRKAAAWGAGSSYRCVEPPVQRTPVQVSGGTSGVCDGSYSLDLNAWMTAHPGALPAGTRVYAQAWFRDPPSSKTTSLSNALDFTVCP